MECEKFALKERCRPPISAVVKDEKEEIESRGKSWLKNRKGKQKSQVRLCFFHYGSLYRSWLRR
jgi:hypothetical protein